MSGLLNTLADIMRQNLWIAPVLSLFAGILTSFTPCSMATVPMLLACVGATSSGPKKAFRLSVVMAAGMAVTFGIFGSVASAIGHRMHEAGHWWTLLMGILMVLMALQIWGVIHLIPHVHVKDGFGKKGYTGAFLTGALGGVFASHCAVPVMVALLALVAELGRNAWWGVLLMILYAVGHSILLIAAGTGYSYLEKLIENPKCASVSKWLKTVLGVVILAIGLLLIFGE